VLGELVVGIIVLVTSVSAAGSMTDDCSGTDDNDIDRNGRTSGSVLGWRAEIGRDELLGL